MALIFSKERSFWWTVTVYVPESDESGNQQTKPYEFDVKLKDHTATGYIKAFTAGGEVFLEYLSSLIIDWRGVQGDDGSEIPCTDENKLMVIDTHYVLPGIIDALKKAHKDVETKNLDPLLSAL